MTGSTPSMGMLLAALLIDRLMGDPAWLWARLAHPVALMGRLIARLDMGLNDPALPDASRWWRGILAVAILAALGGAVGVLLELAAASIPFGFALEALLVAIFLAQKSLIDHVSDVAQKLIARGLPSGRDAVARIVGRDVSVLDEAGVARAAIESAAENFSDGLVAPAFWYALLGLPGLLVFKLANTADSMIGHRTPKHEAFGWAAARLDDLLNIVPARLAALFIAAAAALTGRDAGAALRIALQDAPQHRSPNAGWPEAAAAGALGLALGGPRRYGATALDGAWLNPAGRRSAGAPDIHAATRLIDAAWALVAATVGIIAAIVLW
ncbi:MAG: adenosylcobinamide-phosphate synthase CbiB, partial [Pseudomonadota bacterium]|nr:adenosylcobinamide-phosphate synthase CbiB [Pseudomonadota bacterium]